MAKPMAMTPFLTLSQKLVPCTYLKTYSTQQYKGSGSARPAVHVQLNGRDGTHTVCTATLLALPTS